jgi:hypothetical protein
MLDGLGGEVADIIKVGIMGVLAYFVKGTADSVKENEQNIIAIREDIAKNYQTKEDAGKVRTELREDIHALGAKVDKVIDILTTRGRP